MSDESDVSRLTPDQARSELARLASLLQQANIDYHQNDNPSLSDAEYDRLKRRNAAIEAQFAGLKRSDSPSDQIGAAAAEGFASSSITRFVQTALCCIAAAAVRSSPQKLHGR